MNAKDKFRPESLDPDVLYQAAPHARRTGIVGRATPQLPRPGELRTIAGDVAAVKRPAGDAVARPLRRKFRLSLLDFFPSRVPVE